MESLFSMEYLMSIDAVIAGVGGIVIGILVWQFLREWSWGILGTLILGGVGGVVGGSISNGLDMLNVGDYADPIIAGAIGAILFIGVAGLVRR